MAAKAQLKSQTFMLFWLGLLTGALLIVVLYSVEATGFADLLGRSKKMAPHYSAPAVEYAMPANYKDAYLPTSGGSFDAGAVDMYMEKDMYLPTSGGSFDAGLEDQYGYLPTSGGSIKSAPASFFRYGYLPTSGGSIKSAPSFYSRYSYLPTSGGSIKAAPSFKNLYGYLPTSGGSLRYGIGSMLKASTFGPSMNYLPTSGGSYSSSYVNPVNSYNFQMPYYYGF